jgi:hypothetical protein
LAPLEGSQPREREPDTRLIVVLLFLRNPKQEIRDVGGHTNGVAAIAPESSLVRQCEDRKAAHLPRVGECCLKGIGPVAVAILREQDPSIPLTVTPEKPGVAVARKSEIAESDKTEVERLKDWPELKGYEQAVNVRQMPLKIHIG